MHIYNKKIVKYYNHLENYFSNNTDNTMQIIVQNKKRSTMAKNFWHKSNFCRILYTVDKF